MFKMNVLREAGMIGAQTLPSNSGSAISWPTSPRAFRRKPVTSRRAIGEGRSGAAIAETRPALPARTHAMAEDPSQIER